MGIFGSDCARQAARKAGAGLHFIRLDQHVPPWPRSLAGLRRQVFPQSFRDGPIPLARLGSWLSLAALDGKVVGYALVVPNATFDIDEYLGCILEEVVVAPNVQSRRIGSDLVSFAAQWMIEAGYVTMGTCALHGPDQGRRQVWIERMGFVYSRWGSMETRLESLVAKDPQVGRADV